MPWLRRCVFVSWRSARPHSKHRMTSSWMALRGSARSADSASPRPARADARGASSARTANGAGLMRALPGARRGPTPRPTSSTTYPSCSHTRFQAKSASCRVSPRFVSAENCGLVGWYGMVDGIRIGRHYPHPTPYLEEGAVAALDDGVDVRAVLQADVDAHVGWNHVGDQGDGCQERIAVAVRDQVQARHGVGEDQPPVDLDGDREIGLP